jgi:hypothetical protein
MYKLLAKLLLRKFPSVLCRCRRNVSAPNNTSYAQNFVESGIQSLNGFWYIFALLTVRLATISVNLDRFDIDLNFLTEKKVLNNKTNSFILIIKKRG